MQLCRSVRLPTMTSALCASLVVVSIASLTLAAPLDVKVKAKGTEEVLMYGNHQNAPRVKKSDVASLSPDTVEETAESKDDSSARVPDAAASGQGQDDEQAKSADTSSDDVAADDKSSSTSVEQQRQEPDSTAEQQAGEEAFDPDAYFPYFSPYRRKRASAKALTAEDMTFTSAVDDVRREKRSAAGQQALTAEDMTLTSGSSSSSGRARRDAAPLALTAEDMTSSVTSEKRLQRFKRNIYDGYDINDVIGEDAEDEEDEEDEAIGGYKSRDLDIDDDLSEEEQALLLRYIESNPDLLDALSQYGADERQRADQWERARQAEAEEEDIREALQYLDQIDEDQAAAQSVSDDDDPEIEYEPIVYHGEPGIFIPIPAEVVGEVEKRSRWQEKAEEEAEREQYEEAYGRLLDLARALRRHDYEEEDEK